MSDETYITTLQESFDSAAKPISHCKSKTYSDETYITTLQESFDSAAKPI